MKLQRRERTGWAWRLGSACRWRPARGPFGSARPTCGWSACRRPGSAAAGLARPDEKGGGRLGLGTRTPHPRNRRHRLLGRAAGVEHLRAPLLCRARHVLYRRLLFFSLCSSPRPPHAPVVVIERLPATAGASVAGGEPQRRWAPCAAADAGSEVGGRHAAKKTSG